MKITRVETIPVQVPIKPELAIRSGRGGAHLKSPFLIVKIYTNEGIIGLGEVSCTPRWSGEDHFTAAHTIETYFAPLLTGADPRDNDALYARIASTVAGNYFTKAGVEMALWDIRGKAEGKPLYELLGGAVRDSVPTKWSISGVQPEKAAAIAQWAYEKGFRAMKVKVGTDPKDDVARVRAVRERVGYEVKLGVDANGGWSAETAIATVDRLCDYGILFVEQPVPREDLEGMAEVKSAIELPVIADESVFTVSDARALLRLNGCDAFSVYIGKAGGIAPAMEIAALAAAHSLGCTIGSNLEMGIGSAAMLHLACACESITAERFPCDIIGPFYYEASILQEPLDVTPGAARPTDKPGLGVELEDKVVKQYSLV